MTVSIYAYYNSQRLLLHIVGNHTWPYNPKHKNERPVCLKFVLERLDGCVTLIVTPFVL